MDLIVAFVLGVLGSLVATVLYARYRSKPVVRALVKKLLEREALSRVRTLRQQRGEIGPSYDSPHPALQAEWAIALLDLLSPQETTVAQALETLKHVCRSLEGNESRIAAEAVRLSIATNPHRSLDSVFIETLAEIRKETGD